MFSKPFPVVGKQNHAGVLHQTEVFAFIEEFAEVVINPCNFSIVKGNQMSAVFLFGKGFWKILVGYAAIETSVVIRIELPAKIPRRKIVMMHIEVMEKKEERGVFPLLFSKPLSGHSCDRLACNRLTWMSVRSIFLRQTWGVLKPGRAIVVGVEASAESEIPMQSIPAHKRCASIPGPSDFLGDSWHIRPYRTVSIDQTALSGNKPRKE